MVANKNSRKRDVTGHQKDGARRVKWIDGAKVGQPWSGREMKGFKIAANKSSRKWDPSGWLWKVGAKEKWGQVDGRRHKRRISPLWADVMVRGYPLCGQSSWYGDTPPWADVIKAGYLLCRLTSWGGSWQDETLDMTTGLWYVRRTQW